MRITPTQVPSSDIIVQGKVPSLSVGRQVVATVLSAPRNGLVLVSMFGRHLYVETTLDLKMGQVLNLKVQATSPKVVMKPVETSTEARPSLKALDDLVEKLVGKFGTTGVRSFDVKEIIRNLMTEAKGDPQSLQLVFKLVEDFAQLPPNTVAYLLIPFIQDEDRGHARVTVTRDEAGYRLHFDVQTDALGLVESTVLRTDRGIAVELVSGTQDVVDFLKEHVGELAARLEPLGVTSLDVVQRRPSSAAQANVDVVV